MPVRRIDHIGVAVDDEEAARRIMEDVFGCPEPIEEVVEDQGVRTLIYKLGDAKVELLVPTSPESPVAKHLEKRGAGLHHLAFEVDDLPEALDEVAQQGVELVDDEPRPGVEETKIAFLHPKSTFSTLVELVEFPSDEGPPVTL